MLLENFYNDGNHVLLITTLFMIMVDIKRRKEK